MKTPPGTPRSRSFTRFTIRVALPHLGQSVLLEVSITFLRSAVLAILAIILSCGVGFSHDHARAVFAVDVLEAYRLEISLKMLSRLARLD
jgi:hypothetical protein